jgi:replicative DNA helicase Mcm
MTEVSGPPKTKGMAATLSTQSLVSAWEQFLTDYYKLRIEEAALNYPETRSVEIDYNDLDRRDPNLAQYLLDHPRASIQSSEEALRLIEVPVEPRPALRVRVKNLPRQNRYQVRKLRAEHLGKFIAVEGLIKKVVEVRPKLKDATFQCQRCGAVFNVQQEEQVLTEPKSCDEGQGGCGRDGPFKLLAEESKFIDSQKLEIQESHEDLRGGAQPERITVYLEEDLTGKLYPGDSIVINGVFRAQQRRQGSLKLAEFVKVIDCVSYEIQQMEFEEIEIKPEDLPEIEKISKTADVYKTIRDSFAPEIYGMEKIKDSLILSLFGGVAKEFKDGSRIRGDIHCLLVGDPGVAKCMRGDTSLALATGERPTIASLVDEALRGAQNAVDDGWWAPLRVPIFSMDSRGRVVVKYTSKAWKRTSPDRMIRLRTRSGRSVEVTPTHPLFMTDGVAIHPRQAAEIRVGDFVAAPRRLPTLPIDVTLANVPHVPSRSQNAVRLVRPEGNDPAFWHFAGLLLGDGNVTYRPAQGRWWIEFTNETPELNAVFSEQAARLGLHPASAPKVDSPSRHSWACGVEASSFLTNLGLGGTAAQKSVPQPLLKAGLREQLAFLSGLLDTDGHIAKSRAQIDFATASHDLATGIQDILLRAGIQSVIHRKAVPGYEQPYWRVLVQGSNARGLARLLSAKHPGKAQGLRRLVEEQTRANSNVDVVPVYTRFYRDVREGLGLSQSQCGVPRGTWLGLERGQKNATRSTFETVAQTILDVAMEKNDPGYLEAAQRMATLATSDLFWDEVLSVESVAPSEPYVYDLEVPDTHNFIANGIVNHNSQLLRYLSKLSPRSIYTSGKGTSAAGLTATAVRDEFGEGQWSLEAGALVLADKGVACIDELDKMDENDQSAMHQAMEQQEISVSKAGISATLKSRCAVIGAANPKTGRFDDFAPIVQQINMPPPLLSRFDLIFGLRDRPNKEQDERIARHILGTHRAGEVHMARQRNPDGSFSEEQEKLLMQRIQPVVDEKTLRKYVAYAKRNFYPVLTEDAANSINSFYQTLRNQASGTIGITPRQIEAIIRLAEASAKIRLSTEATQEDANRAISIFTEFLKTVGWNEEAGTIDIDIIAAGASSSQQERMRKVLEIIRRLNGEAAGEGAKLGDVLEQAQASAPPIPADKVEEAIRILKERGSIFQPRGDRFAPL